MTGSIGSLLSSFNTPYADAAKATGKKEKGAGILSTYNESEDPLLMLQKGIKSYKDEHYSGLSDEDKKKIEEEIQKYLAMQKKLGKDPSNFTVEDAEAFQSFVESLKKKYGYKGDKDALEAAADAFGVVSKSQNALQYKFQTEMKVMEFQEYDERLKNASPGAL